MASADLTAKPTAELPTDSAAGASIPNLTMDLPKTRTEAAEDLVEPTTEDSKHTLNEGPSKTSTEMPTESLDGSSIQPSIKTSPVTRTESTPETPTESSAMFPSKSFPETHSETFTGPATKTAPEDSNEDHTEPDNQSIAEPATPIKASSETSSKTSSGPGNQTTSKSSEEKSNDTADNTSEHSVPFWKMLSQEPCKACTFSEQRAHCSSYKSQVKIFYEGSDRGVWSLGSNLILKDRGPELPTDDAANLRFVKENTTILVPTVIHQHETSNEHALTIMTRIPGENLAEAWPKLSNAEKENIAKQTAEYLLQLRLLHSDRIEAHGGRPVFNGYLVKAEDTRFHCPCGPLVSDEEVWTALARRLNPTIPDAARNRLRHSMPPTKPFTFTHQDLAHVNIMVQDGVLTGIVDRERAGYFPVWWEYAMTLFTGEGPEDAQWQGLLRKHMPQMDDVYNWFKTYYFLCLEDLNSSWARDFIEESEKDLA